MSILGRLGLAGRMILIIILVIVPVSLVALFGAWTARGRDAGTGPRVPGPDQIAAMVDLIEMTPLERRTLVLRALNSPEVRVAVQATAPESAIALRMPAFEWLVRSYAEALGSRAARVTVSSPAADSSLLRIFDWRQMRNVGDVQVVVPSGGEFIVIELRQPSIVTMFGLPSGFWTGALGVVLAGLAIVAIVREARPLQDLSSSVSAFAALAAPQQVPVRGAPDVRRLIEAVNDMQARISGLIKGRTVLLGAVSHDLKTYITRLRLRVEDLPDAQRDKAARDLDDMTALVERSIDLARATAAPVVLREVELGALLESDLRARGDGRVAMVARSGQVRVLADDLTLRRLFANLIDNALRHGKRVEVSLVADPDGATVHIDDDGPGVPQSERDVVFEPFYRHDASRNWDTGGSGLGLAIVRQISDAHGATIEIGTSPLAGARFSVRFKAQAMQQNPHSVTAAS